MAVPGGSRLWYDDRDIPFLKEDVKDAAEVRQEGRDDGDEPDPGGWEPDAIIQSIVADDFTLLLGNHTGLTSVQLQPPNTGGTMSSGTA
jgi:hypothetical protein